MRSFGPSTLSHYHTTPLAMADDAKAPESPVEGQLYGRPDRDPSPSPNPGLKKGDSVDAGDEAKGSSDAYPVHAAEDPSVTTENASPTGGRALPQDEQAGPKAAGQGRLETMKDDYGGPGSSGAPTNQGKGGQA